MLHTRYRVSRKSVILKRMIKDVAKRPAPYQKVCIIYASKKKNCVGCNYNTIYYSQCTCFQGDCVRSMVERRREPHKSPATHWPQEFHAVLSLATPPTTSSPIGVRNPSETCKNVVEGPGLAILAVQQYVKGIYYYIAYT